jgi:hypothetical protein
MLSDIVCQLADEIPRKQSLSRVIGSRLRSLLQQGILEPGPHRVSQVLICSALMVDLRRIWRYQQQLARQKTQEVLSLLSRG